MATCMVSQFTHTHTHTFLASNNFLQYQCGTTCSYSLKACHVTSEHATYTYVQCTCVHHTHYVLQLTR